MMPRSQPRGTPEPPSPPESILAGTSSLSADEPWPGLASFGVNDSAFFHGRDLETLELLRLLKRGTLTLIFGKSGLGKSSLLNAGLFPRLRDGGYVPLSVRLDHAESAPPLARQVQAAVGPLWRQAEEATLWECFHRRRVDDAEVPRAMPVVVLDQFEEIFTLGSENAARRARSMEFFHQLADLIENNCPEQTQERFEHDREARRAYDFDRQGFKVIVSMREEYLAFLEEARQPLRNLMPHRMRLVEMSGSQALEAITKSGGHLLDQGVGESIVRFLAGADARPATRRPTVSENIARFLAGAEEQRAAGPPVLEDLEVAPALLSLVCSELNNFRRESHAATISEQLLSGNREQILRGFYERCFLDLNSAVREFVEDQLLTTSGYRDSMALEDAVALKDVSAEELEVLVERRLLRLDRRGGTARLEITHDILVGPCRRSRDLRYLEERGWWNKVKSVASYTEKFMAISGGVPLALFAPFIFWDRQAMVPALWKLFFVVPLSVIWPMDVLWIIALFVRQSRWTWVVRLATQLALCAIGWSGLVNGLRNFQQGEVIMLIWAYCLLLSNALALIHLFSIREAVFPRRRTAMTSAKVKPAKTP